MSLVFLLALSSSTGRQSALANLSEGELHSLIADCAELTETIRKANKEYIRKSSKLEEQCAALESLSLAAAAEAIRESPSYSSK